MPRNQLAASRFVTERSEPDEIGNSAARSVLTYTQGATSSSFVPDSNELSEYFGDTAFGYAAFDESYLAADQPRYTFRADGSGSTEYASRRADFQTLPSAGTESAPRRTGAHRLPAPPTALKGRAAVVAVAAGAVVAAGQAAVGEIGQPNTAEASTTDATTAVAAQFLGAPDATGPAETVSSTSSAAPQVLTIASPTDTSQFTTMLAKGEDFAAQKAAQEAAARRPLFVLPAVGTFTSGFGSRWGTLHAGVDIANAIGTPILAVADGVVIDAGPASGFGMWVRLKHDDGTITVYGHIDSATVTVGQRVMAGDEIAKMGNRGFSTGPHCHFEVWLNGSDKVDPLPWLASRGISLGPERD